MLLEDRSRTYVSVTRFPDGDVKVSGCHRPSPGVQRRARPKPSRLEVQEKAAKRATTKVRDLVKFNQFGYLHTLTYRGPVRSRAKVSSDMKRWSRLVRKSLPDFRCVGVLEYHRGGGANDGGIHVHYATGQFYPVDLLRAAWWRVVGERQGNIQIERRIFRSSPSDVGRYLAKYVSKDFDDQPREFGQHRYFRSAGVSVVREKLVFFKGFYKQHLATARALFILNCKRGETFRSEWFSDDGWQFVFRSYG